MKLIIIGDIVGKPGRKVLTSTLKRLKEKHETEFVVANVENAAEGAGLVPKVGDEILAAGVDVMTSGNHIFDKKEVIQYIENQPHLLRPANYAPDAPGRGLWLGSTDSGTQVAVINVQGRIFMPPAIVRFERSIGCWLKSATAHRSSSSITTQKRLRRSWLWAAISTDGCRSWSEHTLTFRRRTNR